MVQSYLPGCGNVHPIKYTPNCTGTIPVLPPAESLWVYRPPDMFGHVISRPLFPSKLPLHVSGSGSPSNTFPWTHLAPHLNGISTGSAIFAQLMANHILYNGPPLPPSKAPLCMGIWTLTWFLWSTRVHTQTASRSVHLFLQGSWP